MSKSTFQKSPTKILVDALSTTTITYPGGNDVVITVGGQTIKFNLDTDKLECTAEQCYNAGTKETASIVLTNLFTDTCDCVQCFDIKVVEIGGTDYKIANAYPKVRPYRACTPKGVALVVDSIGADLVKMINADKNSPVEAAYFATLNTPVPSTLPSGTAAGNAPADTLKLWAKNPGINKFAVASSAGTWTTVAGTNPVLTADDMYKEFPPQTVNVGNRGPKTTGTSTNYCRYYIKIRKNDANDPIEGGGEFSENAFFFYVDSSLSTYNADWKNKWDACNFNAS